MEGNFSWAFLDLSRELEFVKNLFSFRMTNLNRAIRTVKEKIGSSGKSVGKFRFGKFTHRQK